MNLDNKIPEGNLTFRERIELLIADKRGKINLKDYVEELSSVDGAVEYAEERSQFWIDWNKNYKKKYKKMDTQERYIAAQHSSEVYENAVYKSLKGVICTNIITHSFISDYSLEKSIFELQELLWMYQEGSYFMLKKPLNTLMEIIEIIKKNNLFLGISFEKHFRNFDSDTKVRNWININK